MTKGQFNYIFALVVCLSGCSLVAANPCSSTFYGNVPHPVLCYKYYSCVIWVASERTCPDHQIFNGSDCEDGNQETCEFWWQITPSPEPQNTTTPEPPATTTREPPANLDGVCNGVFFGARPHPESLELFVGCIRESPLLFKCLDDELFSETFNECRKVLVDPETTREPTEPTALPTSVIPEITTLSNPCAGRPRGNIPNEDSCVDFFYCFSGNAFVRSCVEGFVFSREQLDCVPGDQGTCTEA